MISEFRGQKRSRTRLDLGASFSGPSLLSLLLCRARETQDSTRQVLKSLRFESEGFFVPQPLPERSAVSPRAAEEAVVSASALAAEDLEQR